MKQTLLSTILLLAVYMSGCNKSKDAGPLPILSGKENIPFTLKNGQVAKIDVDGNQAQVTLVSLSSCVTNGVTYGTGYVYLNVTQGVSDEVLKITVPQCNFQQGDSLTSTTTKIGKNIIVNAIQYEKSETVGLVNGVSATFTIR